MTSTMTSAYGRVDAVVLQRLQSTFDTTMLLKAVDELDAVHQELGEPDGLRTALLTLHAMVHTVLNGGSVAIADSESLPAAAAEIELQLDEMATTLRKIRDIVHLLAELEPDDEDVPAAKDR